MARYVETLKPIGHRHAGPPLPFLIRLVSWAKGEAAEVFAPNLKDDIYGYLRGKVATGGWKSMLHRKAAMCEGLRIIAGDESDWNWKEGRDLSAGHQTLEQEEVGAFQFSYDSINLGADLLPFLHSCGINNVRDFQMRMKADPELQMAYAARLLRDSTSWDGPMNRGWVREQASPAAVAEFMALLSS